MGACRKGSTSTGSVSDPKAAFIQECLSAPFDHTQSCSSSSGNLGKYERYSKGQNYALDIWISCLVGKMSAVLISDLMACLGALLFICISNVWVVVIMIAYNQQVQQLSSLEKLQISEKHKCFLKPTIFIKKNQMTQPSSNTIPTLYSPV